VAGVEEGGLGEAGDHARVVQGGAVAAVSGYVDAFEDIGPGGDGLAGRGAEAPHPSARRAGSGPLGGGVGGHHGGGQAGGKGDLRRLGVDADGEPGGGGMVPPSKQAPRIGTMSCRRRAMSGALREAVAMLVRGQRVAVTIRVSRAARDPSRRGPPPQDRRGGWGRGDRSAPSAAPDEAVLRC
jgi:hypothetical protein